jgi:hypothetical protein
MRKLLFWIGGAVLMFELATGALLGQGRSGPAGKPPPRTFDKSVADAFFKDVRKEVGPGQPGNAVAAAATGSSPSAGGTTSPGTTPSVPEAGSSIWTRMIAAETLENEIKSGMNLVAETVQSPTKFNTSHNTTRRVYSVLAVAFAVIADYGGEVRFKDKAAGMRDALAKAGFNCKVASTGAFNEAKLRFQDLQELVRGGNVAVESGEAKVKFADIANRPPLMQRMEEAALKNLQPLSADSAQFKANKDKILHEAQILAILAKAIQDDGYDSSADEAYQTYARTVEKHALEIAEAIQLESFDKARAALGNITKTCDACHADYR